MPKGGDTINPRNELSSMPEENERQETNTRMLRELVVPDEVALALGDIERRKSPDEAFFLF